MGILPRFNKFRPGKPLTEPDSISAIFLCWPVAVTNLSEDRVTIMKVDFVDEDPNHKDTFVQLSTWVRTNDDKDLPSTWTIEPGATENIRIMQEFFISRSEETKLKNAGIAALALDENKNKLTLANVAYYMPNGICVPLGDVEKNGECRAHYSLRVTTIQGTVFVVRTGMPQLDLHYDATPK